MACLIIGGIHQAIRGIQSGLQAHKDFKSVQESQAQQQDPSQAINNTPLDRYGHPKEQHPVYGWVMKAEIKYNKGKGGSQGRALKAHGDELGGQADIMVEADRTGNHKTERKNYKANDNDSQSLEEAQIQVGRKCL
jgi:hypothetical protein